MVAELPDRETAPRPGESPGQPLTALIAACQTGDYDAFSQLFALYKDRVYSIALRFSGNPTAAMDIAQDVFLKLLAQVRNFRGDSKFDTWLYRLVVNACLDHNRRERRWLPLLDNFIGKFRSDARAEQGQMHDQVAQAVAQLPADQRLAVVLRYTEGLSYEQIAEIAGVPSGTVASRLNRAHATLAQRLSHWKGAL